MTDLRSVFSMQGQLFLLILLGVLFRRKLSGPEFQRDLSTVLVDLLLPCNIIASFQTAMTGELIARSLHVLLIALAGQLFACFLAVTAFRRADPERRSVMQYSTICSNSGYLGIPVAESLWGAPGVLLTSIYLLPQRIAMWSLGVSFYSPEKGKDMWKKLLTNPCIVAMDIGLVLMVTQWKLPAVLQGTITSLSRCTTGLSMFLVGMIVTQIRWSEFLDRDVLAICALRLVVLPGVMLLLCRLLGVDALAANICVMLTAMPAGAATAVMAARYHRAEAFAADVVTVSTLLSLVTIPLWAILLA